MRWEESMIHDVRMLIVIRKLERKTWQNLIKKTVTHELFVSPLIYMYTQYKDKNIYVIDNNALEIV